jgi:hypothetical protein
MYQARKVNSRVKGINYASFYHFYIWFWNYCDNVVLLGQCGIIVTMWNYCDNVELL